MQAVKPKPKFVPRRGVRPARNAQPLGSTARAGKVAMASRMSALDKNPGSAGTRNRYTKGTVQFDEVRNALRESTVGAEYTDSRGQMWKKTSRYTFVKVFREPPKPANPKKP